MGKHVAKKLRRTKKANLRLRGRMSDWENMEVPNEVLLWRMATGLKESDCPAKYELMKAENEKLWLTYREHQGASGLCDIDDFKNTYGQVFRSNYSLLFRFLILYF